MSDSLRRFLLTLREKGEIRSTNPLMRKNGQKLVDLGAISPIRRGRSEFYRIENQDIIDAFTNSNFPSGLDIETTSRLDGILHARDSKKGGNATETHIIMRVFSDSTDEYLGFNAQELTEQNGVVAILTGAGLSSPSGVVTVVENMDIFLRVEEFIPECDLAIFASGKLDERIIKWMSESQYVQKIVHLGDYDAVGLQEYQRLERVFGTRVKFFLHPEIKLEHFSKFGKKDLVASGNNLSVFKKVQSHETNDVGFNSTINLIRESGRGLEQEFLLSFIK